MTTDIMITFLRNLALYGHEITDNDRRKLTECAERMEELDDKVRGWNDDHR